MKFTYYLVVVEDPHGNKDAGVVAELGDTVQICGMKTATGDDVYFESDACHLAEWCERYGLTFKEIKKEETV